MPKVLVTGANGLIGSHLVRSLLRRGHSVNCLVRHTGDLSSLRGLPVELFIGDVCEPSSLQAPMAGVEYVFHLAAELMATDHETFDTVIREGTHHMLEATAQHAAKPLKRFLYVSSQAAAGPGDDPTPGDETAPRRPISWYGHAKAAAEDVVLSYAERLPVTIVRPAGVYGDRERDISQLYGAVENHLHPQLGVLTKYAVLVHVDDVVQGIIDAADSSRTLGATYFLNHPEILTARQVTKTIANAMDKPRGLTLPIPISLLQSFAPFVEYAHQFTRERPKITRDKVREVAQRYWVSDPSKACRDFGWTAKSSLLDGMKRTVAWYRTEQADRRTMPLERCSMLWAKYVTCAIALGALIEAISHLGRFYTFQPWWLVFVVILGAFGLSLGTVSFVLRRSHWLIQFLVGTALAFLVEVLNVLVFHAWTFAPGWPFGINDPWVRSAVLGLAGGVFVLVVNAVMRALYVRRLRLG